jgi:hypothetical protein
MRWILRTVSSVKSVYPPFMKADKSIVRLLCTYFKSANFWQGLTSPLLCHDAAGFVNPVNLSVISNQHIFFCPSH